MSTSSTNTDFEEFVGQCGGRLIRTAELLTGSRARAEDLVQDALARSYLRWEQLRPGSREAYVRRAILHGYLDWWRRVRWRELPETACPAVPDSRDQANDVIRRTAVLGALAMLTPRERSVMVLRYWLDLPESQIADELGVAAGTVKSTANRALRKLREHGDLSIFSAAAAQPAAPAPEVPAAAATQNPTRSEELS